MLTSNSEAHYSSEGENRYERRRLSLAGLPLGRVSEITSDMENASSSVLNLPENDQHRSFPPYNNIGFHPLQSYRTRDISNSSDSLLVQNGYLSRYNNSIEGNSLVTNKSKHSSKSALDLPTLLREKDSDEQEKAVGTAQEKKRIKFRNLERIGKRLNTLTSPEVRRKSFSDTEGGTYDEDGRSGVDGNRVSHHKSKEEREKYRTGRPFGIIRRSRDAAARQEAESSTSNPKMPPRRTGPAIANIASSIAIATSYHSPGPTDVECSESSDNEVVRRIPVQPPTPMPKSSDLGEGIVPKCPVDHQSAGKQVLNSVFPCSIEQLYDMLLTNSKFYTDFQLARGTCDIKVNEWMPGDGSKKTRQITFTALTGQSIGPRQVFVTETQTMLPASQPGLLYAVESDSVNAGVPFSDAFSVVCHFCMKRVSDNETRYCVFSRVNFKKNVWTKTFIEKNSTIALVAFFEHLEKALREECAKVKANTAVTIIVSPPVAKRRKKSRAPDIPNACKPTTEVAEPRLESEAPRKFKFWPKFLSGSVDDSLAVKMMMTALIALLLLNIYLLIRLSSIETLANNSGHFSGPRETPKNQQEWMLLLQERQEMLQREEMQNWQNLIEAAVQILRKTEKDLEGMKTQALNTWDLRPT